MADLEASEFDGELERGGVSVNVRGDAIGVERESVNMGSNSPPEPARADARRAAASSPSALFALAH